MGVRGELFTTDVSVENRTYFFNVKENRTGDVFLQVVESKNTEGAGFDRHAIVVFEDDMQKFLQGLESTLKFIEKNRKSKISKGDQKTPGAGRKYQRKDSQMTKNDSSEARPARYEKSERDAKQDPNTARPARKVRVIPKKQA